MTDHQQPYSVQQQPPPSASGCRQDPYFSGGCPCDCHTDPAPSTGATAGWEHHSDERKSPRCYRCGLPWPCDAVQFTAEVAQLRADLAYAQAERERLSGHVREAAQALVGEAALHAEIKQLRAQVQAMRAVVEPQQQQEVPD